MLYARNDPAAALADFTHVIEQDPNHGPAYLGRADIYYDQGKRTAVLADYRRFLELYTVEDEWTTRVRSRIKELSGEAP